jgi:RNA polymerase sigma factor (sigma-70 family)
MAVQLRAAAYRSQTAVKPQSAAGKVAPSTHRKQAPTMSEATDEAIDEAIAQAFRDHAASIEGLALRSTRDRELAADVTQEAFLRLVVEAQAGRFPDNVGGWLYRTSMNLIVSQARRAAVARRLAPSLVPSGGPTEPDSLAVAREERRELQVALEVLSQVDRVVLLKAANGASGEELARDLERSAGATRTLLCRARTRLRNATTQVQAGVPAL